MGIDNDAVLVYGWVFEWKSKEDEILCFLYNQGVIDANKPESEEIQEVFQNYLNKFGLKLGYVSPYYDADADDLVYYLTYIDNDDNLKNELKYLLNLNENLKKPNFTFTEEEPNIFCLSHIH